MGTRYCLHQTPVCLFLLLMSLKCVRVAFGCLNFLFHVAGGKDAVHISSAMRIWPCPVNVFGQHVRSNHPFGHVQPFECTEDRVGCKLSDTLSEAFILLGQICSMESSVCSSV